MAKTLQAFIPALLILLMLISIYHGFVSQGVPIIHLLLTIFFVVVYARSWRPAFFIALGLSALAVYGIYRYPVGLYSNVNVVLFGTLLLAYCRYRSAWLVAAAFTALGVLHIFMETVSIITLLCLLGAVAIGMMSLTRNLNHHALIISLFAAVAVSEGVLRVMGMDTAYMEKNGFVIYTSPYSKYQKPLMADEPFANRKLDYEGTEFEQARNRHGVVDDDHLVEKGTDEVRILTAGDSFTENCCAPFEDGWTQVLERKLDSLSGMTVTVVNQGVGGSDPVAELYKYDSIFYRYSPDIVLLAINESDIDDMFIHGSYEARYGADGQSFYPVEGPWWEPLYGMSYVARRMVHGLFHMDSFFLSEYDDDQGQRKLAQFMDVCQRWQERAARDSFELLLVFHPFEDHFRTVEWQLAPVRDSLQERGFDVVDLYRGFKAAGIDSSNVTHYYIPIDGHHNSRGNRLWAEVLMPEVVARYPLLLGL